MIKERTASFGPRLIPGGGASFRVWAPKRRAVEVVVEDGGAFPLRAESGGWFAGDVAGLTAGALYRFRLDGEGPFPDPASRFQPRGVHGPSQLIDPGSYQWRTSGWRGPSLEGQVMYELHLGTFSREGTWAGAAKELPRLARLGVTCVEVMPVADFAGSFGWGYDGVAPFAPSRLYGSPDDAKAFVDAAHGLGLAVLLDVVYNHFGPDGNYATQFSDHWFTKRHVTDWGDAINYDGEGSAEVRRFVIENARQWVGEYRFDGLRLDATQNIYDDSPEHLLAAIARAARAEAAADGRRILLVAESETQEARLLRSLEDGGCGFDAIWNDDFHHSALVALTGVREAYLEDYRGSPQELISTLKRGTLYQGQRYRWQKKPRGEPFPDAPGMSFVAYLENHDQTANTSHDGARLVDRADPALLRALTTILLLGPGTPLLFQGQEYGSRSPFTFFADHGPGLRELVYKGRREFMRQFPSVAAGDAAGLIPDPADPAARERCRLRPPEETPDAERWFALHRDLLELRRSDAAFRSQDRKRLDGAVLGERAFCARFPGPGGDDRLLLVNLGARLELEVLPEPLLAPPAGRRWRARWSSEDPRYGGRGAAETAPGESFFLAARSAAVLEARRDV